MSGSFVCAFRGRRDSYQVPLALAEASLLDQFITDAFAPRWLRHCGRYLPPGIQQKVAFRSEPGIPSERVRCLWGTTLLEHSRHRLGYARALTFMSLDRRFSAAAARRAERERSDLLLYSPYAWEAFVATYSHTPRRVLFQYHPHPELECRILEEDHHHYPEVGESFSGDRSKPLPEDLARRERDCWRHADLILCASSFTRQSLLAAGAAEEKCRIVPYGIDMPAVAESALPDRFHPVFVGSGSQRKGLHHLLHAWQRADLPAESVLTIVCRKIDRAIERLAEETARVRLVRGLSESALGDLYASSSLFVMPSLVEGFGQVYLEALAHGCPVLGTRNTCLPDLGKESDGVFLTPPGLVEPLAAKLAELCRMLAGNGQIRIAARQCAERFSWTDFRSGIVRALGDDTEPRQDKAPSRGVADRSLST